jgi:hypothetical protein
LLFRFTARGRQAIGLPKKIGNIVIRNANLPLQLASVKRFCVMKKNLSEAGEAAAFFVTFFS